MHDMEALYTYSRYHPRWFESPSQYVPNKEHLDAYRASISNNWELRRSGLWYVATAPEVSLPEQGWKLHISVRADDSVACLRRALKCLLEENVSFKFLVDPPTVSAVNSKLWPRSSSGKFITVYPSDEDKFSRLGRRLSHELKDFVGPYILSDRCWPGSSCVYYRYGGFSPQTILRIDGSRQFVISDPAGTTTPDVRHPYWSVPDWAVDPVKEYGFRSHSDLSLDGGRFAVQSALKFSNRGGVYRAIDRDTGRDVIIKESRPYIEVGRNRIDAVDVLRKEYRLLTDLAGCGYFVKPIKYFQESEHAFLVEDFVPGDHIGQFTIRRNPLYHGVPTEAVLDQYYADVRQLWLQLAQALKAAHQRGIVLGDISFSNVVVTDDFKIQIIDMECGVKEGVDPSVGLHTPGMATDQTMRSGICDRANDFYGLGAIMFGSIMLAHSITGLHKPAGPRFLAALTDDVSLSHEFIALINELMGPACEERLDTDQLVERIAETPIRSAKARSSPVEREVQLGGRSCQDPDAHTLRLADETREAVMEYLHGIAAPTRNDRLFPADLSVFETNPLSVAYGAAGVLYAMHRINGEAPQNLVDWMVSKDVSSNRYPPGLYLGQAGVAWVLHELGYSDAAISVMHKASKHELLFQSPDVFFGASGYGLTCLKLWKADFGDKFLDEAIRVGDFLVASGVRDDRGVHWSNRDGNVPLGYAFGGSGISLFLLYLHRATGDTQALDVGRAALDFELEHAIWQGEELAGFPALVPEREVAAKVVVPRCYWDAGSAGVLTTLARFLSVTPDTSLQRWLTPLAQDVTRKYAAFPHLFRGLSGMGNSLLDVWERTTDKNFLGAAWRAAEGVLLSRIDCVEGVGFPGEQAMRESADFATGAAGVALFLDRLLRAGSGGSENFNFVVDELLPATSTAAIKSEGLGR
ncbi:class III lanthionine synthetase LanKC [Streptomyces chartreusis]|uniref:class III lanthionine synthetase LanKC n=1 Tax=Streptomyces chartreusis TaxID=1969 RepID=UPI00363E62F3